MSKVSINELTLTNIGAAIREKTGKTDLIAPGDMPAEIRAIVSGGGGSDDCNGLHVPEEALTISGDCQYKFYGGGWDWFIRDCGDKITTNGITHSRNMFDKSNVVNIPFDLNYVLISGVRYNNITAMFQNGQYLEVAPKMNNVKPDGADSLFLKCNRLKSISDDYFDTWDWSYFLSQTSEYAGSIGNMFNACHALRKIPQSLFKRENLVKPMAYSYSLYYWAFYCCYCLEQIKDLPVINGSAWTTNAFNNTFFQNSHLKKLTFELQEDGSAYEANWKSQIIDLTTNCGYGSLIRNYNTDFTNDNKITTPEQWHGYIDGTYPDGWSDSLEYATFGKTAATELINTVPDTSTYLASGGVNTIKFKANAASAIPGENISELSEEVIAVAAAKGWTVSYV